MLWITGDLHGRRENWETRVAPVLRPGDTLIVTGDFGVGFWEDETAFYDALAEQPFTVLFLDGNHENFAQLNAYPTDRWNGGQVHRLRHNLLHLMRGELYTVAGRSCFVFGGGASADRFRRSEADGSWWPEELPSLAEYENGRRNLQAAGWQADLILTHTAPAKTVSYLASLRNLGLKESPTAEIELTEYLETLRQSVRYQRWYFGHFHADRALWYGQTLVYRSMLAQPL